jgi:hypothetical protein
VKDFNMRVDSWQRALHVPLNPSATVTPTHGALTLTRRAIHMSSISNNKNLPLPKDWRKESLQLKMPNE